MSQFASRVMTPPPVYNDGGINSTLRPYLTLPYLLSLTWLAYPILSLLFIIFRLQISSTSAQDAVNDAKDNLLLSCRAAEQAATSAASLPRFMAIGMNKQFADAINATMNGSREALILVLTCMEAIINFIIDIYRSTFLCFLELAIRGGLAILIGAVQDISSFIQSSLASIRTGIQNDVSTFNSLVQDTVNGLNAIIPFGNPVKAPQLTVPSLDSLQNVTLPTTFQDALTSLNNSIPSLDQLRQSIQGFVDTPFELVKADINNTFANLTFDPQLLSIPDQNTLSFCGGLDTSVVDNLGNDLLKIARIGTGLLLITVLLMLVGNCVVEWWKWRSLKRNLERTRLAWGSDPTVYHNTNEPEGLAPSLHLTDHNLLTLHATSSHPLLTRLANKLSSLFNLTPTQYTHLQFFFHYVFHPPALACFLIGFFGILSVQLQLLAVHPLAAKYSDQAAAAVGDFSNTIASSINSSMYNQSAVYADGINSKVAGVQNTVNDGLFGWVNGTTTTLNQTLNDFYSDVQNVVNQIFGGTVLESPAQDFIQCILGSKVEAFENALTFLHNNLQINLPTVNESALVLSQDEINEVSQPISAAAVGGGDGQDQGGLVGKLITRYAESLKQERIMFGVFLALWFFVVLIALGIISWHSFGKPALDKYRKRRYDHEKAADLNTSGFSWPPPSETTRIRVGPDNELQSFTPTIDAPGGFWSSFRHNTVAPVSIRADMGNEKGGNGSFDAFLDSKISKSLRNPFKGTRKLRAVGRKSMGREILVSDEEARERELASERGTEVDEEAPSTGWLSKMKSFARLAKSDPTASDGAVTPFELSDKASEWQSSPTEKPRLTISTASMPGKNNLPQIDTSQTPMPGSAWSVSPNPQTPRRLPWLHGVNMSPKRSEPPTLPGRSLPRSSLPPFQAFQRPIPDMPISPPLPLTPVFINPRGGLASQTSRQHLSLQPISPSASMTPVTFLLTTTHARSSSHVLNTPMRPTGRTAAIPATPATAEANPFVTPFDDEQSVPYTPKAV